MKKKTHTQKDNEKVILTDNTYYIKIGLDKLLPGCLDFI